jgi:hypothetical protein
LWSGIRWCLTLWLASRTMFVLLAAVMSAFTDAARGIPSDQWVFRVYSHQDAGHFLSIATSGYFPADSADPQHLRTAFFPGYPLLVRLIARSVFGGHPHTLAYFAAAAILTWVASYTSAVQLWFLTWERTRQRVAANVAAAAFFFGPYGVFLMAPYSESLYLTCALGAWLAGLRHRWAVAGMLAAAATSVRVNGLFLAAALIVMFLQHNQADHAHRERRSIWSAAWLALPTLPILSYLGWLHAKTGHWSQWQIAQHVGWARTTVWPWKALWNSTQRLWHFHRLDLVFQDVMELLGAAILLGGTTLLLRRRAWPEFTYLGLTALSLLTSAYYLSVPRSLLTCFPLFVILGQSTATQHRNRGLIIMLAVLSTFVLLVDTASLLTNRWAG